MAISSDLTFSVSVPVYRQAAFLRTALQSLRTQRVPIDLAVLDASPDDAAQHVIHDYDSMIAYRYHRADMGQAAAVREGWDHTGGEILAWLNADDYYYPDALARVAAVFQSSPEVDVVYGHGVHVSADGVFQSYFPAIDPDIAKVARGCVVCQPACFVRRRAVERVGGLDPTLIYTMDWDLWLRLFRAGCTFRFLDAPLAAVRVHEWTKTLTGAAGRYREIRRLLRAAGAVWPRRIVTVSAFHHYDLRNRRRGVLAWAAYRALTAAFWAWRVARRRRRTRIGGLECWTNRVAGECLVPLPWYDGAPPQSVTLLTDRPVSLSLTCNGEAASLAHCGAVSTTALGERFVAQAYRAELARGEENALVFRVASRDGPWRLLSLGVDADIPASHQASRSSIRPWPSRTATAAR
jgi:GT2 family glycosyltransferase